MSKRYLSRCLLLAVLLAAPALGQVRVPLMTTQPQLDGKIDPAEWAASIGFEGLIGVGELTRRQARVYIGATSDTIYVAVRSQTPSTGTLTTKVKTDTTEVVYDDAVEVYVNPLPDAKDSVAYQMLFNSAGRTGYDFRCIGKEYEKDGWGATWKVANSVRDGWWDSEVAIPINTMRLVRPGRKTTDGAWRVNVTRDWKNPWEWSSLTGGDFATGGITFVVDPHMQGDRGPLYYDRKVTAASGSYQWDARPEAIESELLSVAPGKNEEFFGSRIQRTMTLLATSNPDRHMPVHIVIYGQSITGSSWSDYLDKELKARFPDADIKLENRSIGGLGADILSRVAYHQLYPYYPDLVIFHCYGAERDYERIFSDIKRYTTSEIMLFTHHVMDVHQDGQLPWEKRGFNISTDRSADEIRYLAQKYGCELVELREEWKQYIHDHSLQPSDLLTPDGVHMNTHGQELMANLIGRHFRFSTLFPGSWDQQVRFYDARRPVVDFKNDEITYTGREWTLNDWCMLGNSPKSSLKLTFEGNRVDIVAGVPSKKDAKLGTARVLIDGKPPSKFQGCYFFTTPSGGPGTWMPGLLRVRNVSPIVLEDWTLRITTLTADAKEFSYEVIGSLTGPDGTGNNKQRFVSKSGRVVIEPQDLERITWGHNATAKRAYPGFEVKWKVAPMFLDTYTAPAMKDRTHVTQVTVAQGLPNGKHTLEIVPNGDGEVPIEGVQVYRPEMSRY